MIVPYILLAFILYHIIGNIDQFIPNASIPYTSQQTYRVTPIDESRTFDLCDSELLDEIDELRFAGTGPTETYSFLVKGYVCNITLLEDSDIIEDPLVLVGNNEFTWDSESYFVCGKEVYFPKPGSILIKNAPKRYRGPPLRVVIGKKNYIDSE